MRSWVLVLVCAGCSKEAPPPDSGPSPTSAPAVVVLSADDAPILTEALIEHYLSAVADDAVPLSTLLTRKPAPAFDELPKQILELDRLAKKHGFRDVKELEAVGWRITTGHLQLMTEQMTAGAIELLEVSNAADEEELARPGTDEARRAELDGRLARGRASIAEMKGRRTENRINKSDMALIAKNRERITAAERKMK